MIETIKKYFTSISKLCVLEQITFDSKIEYNYIELLIKKNELKILKQETFISIHSFKKLNSNKLPVILNVNGINVLTKNNPTNIDAFDNDTFYYSISTIDDNNYYCIVRKDVVTETLNFIKSNNFLLVDIQIGAYNILKYEEILLNKENVPKPHTFKNKNNISHYTFEKKDDFLYEKITIGENEVPTNLLSPLATGIDYIINTQYEKEDSGFSISRNESVYAKLTSLTLVLFLGILLTTLLINFAYQNHLSNKYKDSEYRSGILNDKKNQISYLKSSIIEKKRVFNEYGLSSGSQFSEYLDVLASLRPNQLVLTSMNINPLTKELKEGKKVELNSNKIFITGNVFNVETLNEYLIKIENNKLFVKAKIVAFIQGKSSANFELEIEI